MNLRSINARHIFLGIVALLGIAAIFIYHNRMQPIRQTPVQVPISQIAAKVQAGDVEKLEVSGENVYATLKDKSELISLKESGTTLQKTLIGLGVSPERLQGMAMQVTLPQRSPIGTALNYIFAGVFALVLILIVSKSQNVQNQMLTFGNSRARMTLPDQPQVTFEDVAGAEEAKQELTEVVEFLKDPEKFVKLGARIPKGVLLVGNPGTGKTLLAKAASGEAGVPFFSVAASEFVEQFVGVGASRVRDLFSQARKHSPCIVFVDELDAAGRRRGNSGRASDDERAQTLNQILVEMDGMNSDVNVIVMAATNRPDILDPALLRPGRFDRRVVMDQPDIRGREEILKVHTRGKPLGEDVDLAVVAKSTAGLVGADLENLVNEAAILAARHNKKAIGLADFEEAVERVTAGPERKSRVINERDREVIAYHEAGHALVMQCLPEHDPVHKVSIIPRGMTQGYTMALPSEDRSLYSQQTLRAKLAALLGGRAAEELIFGDVTTGAANDLERATKIARAMVTRYGMSQELGPMVFGQSDGQAFLGPTHGLEDQRNYSEQVATQIDAEVHNLVEEAYSQAKAILTEWGPRLDRVANTLMVEETLDAERLQQILTE